MTLYFIIWIFAFLHFEMFDACLYFMSNVMLWKAYILKQTPNATWILAYIFFIFIKIFFSDNISQQKLEFDCAAKNSFWPRMDENGPFRRKLEIMLHVELVGFMVTTSVIQLSIGSH